MDSFLFFLILALVGGLTIGADVIAWSRRIKYWEVVAKKRRRVKVKASPLLTPEARPGGEGGIEDRKG